MQAIEVVDCGGEDGMNEECGKVGEKESHKLQGEWFKQWARTPSKELGAAEAYQGSRW
jgi:hypothetical protein